MTPTFTHNTIRVTQSRVCDCPLGPHFYCSDPWRCTDYLWFKWLICMGCAALSLHLNNNMHNHLSDSWVHIKVNIKILNGCQLNPFLRWVLFFFFFFFLIKTDKKSVFYKAVAQGAFPPMLVIHTGVPVWETVYVCVCCKVTSLCLPTRPSNQTHLLFTSSMQECLWYSVKYRDGSVCLHELRPFQ